MVSESRIIKSDTERWKTMYRKFDKFKIYLKLNNKGSYLNLYRQILESNNADKFCKVTALTKFWVTGEEGLVRR